MACLDVFVRNQGYWKRFDFNGHRSIGRRSCVAHSLAALCTYMFESLIRKRSRGLHLACSLGEGSKLRDSRLRVLLPLRQQPGTDRGSQALKFKTFGGAKVLTASSHVNAP